MTSVGNAHGKDHSMPKTGRRSANDRRTILVVYGQESRETVVVTGLDTELVLYYCKINKPNQVLFNIRSGMKGFNHRPPSGIDEICEMWFGSFRGAKFLPASDMA